MGLTERVYTILFYFMKFRVYTLVFAIKVSEHNSVYTRNSPKVVCTTEDRAVLMSRLNSKANCIL